MKYLLLFLVILLTACETVVIDPSFGTMAYVPVYASRESVESIATEGPKATKNPGKIYAYGSYLFQVEQYEGIHIIDNVQPSAARKVAFLKVPLCTEISIKDHHLYTNNHDDLVVFNLSSMAAPKLVKRLVDAFPEVSQSYPPFTNVFFECADPSKGIVVRWEQKNVQQPKCRR